MQSICKNPTKILLDDAFAKYLTYLLTLRYVLKFDNLCTWLGVRRYCNSWIHGECRQGFCQTFTNIFLFFFHVVLRFSTFFL